jgi:hypothetical protein
MSLSAGDDRVAADEIIPHRLLHAIDAALAWLEAVNEDVEEHFQLVAATFEVDAAPKQLVCDFGW